jgi:hypothetical protein
MSEFFTFETPGFAWYQVGKFEDLEQGDLLPSCPLVILPDDLTPLLQNYSEGDEVDFVPSIDKLNLIMMSQSCDLANDKISQVLLCGYFPAANQSKNIRENIRKERMPALHLIEKCDAPNYFFEQQIIDFRTIYTLPKNFVSAFAKTLETRARLLSPYKEHLSQAFARYFMRVGLPRPLRDE